METKICSKCKIEKNTCEFGKDKSRKDGLSTKCRFCISEYDKKRYNEKSEIIKEQRKKYYNDNKEKVSKINNLWKENNKDKRKEIIKRYYENNKESVKLSRDKYRSKNKDKIISQRKLYNQKNKPKILEYQKFKRNYDILFKLKQNMRSRLNIFLKSRKLNKKNPTFNIIGCTPEFLKEYLEKLFIQDMCWENRDKWHIDHIVPLSSANTEEEIYKLCHYTNLQPLWAEDNLKKSNKMMYL